MIWLKSKRNHCDDPSTNVDNLTYFEHGLVYILSSPWRMGRARNKWTWTLTLTSQKSTVTFRGVYPYLPMATTAPWSILGGMNKKLLKRVFALYSLPIIFSKNFFARYARSIAFYPQLTNASMDVFYQPHLYIYFLFFGVIIPDCQLLKFTENTHKIAQNCI